MSTLQGGGKFVNDELVFYVDALNTKSYPLSGTTWFDLSRSSQNATLTNGVTYSSDGSFVFDGIDDFISTNLNTQFGDFTACVWFKDTGGATSSERLLDKNYVNGFWIGRESANVNRWGGGVRESTPPYGRYITLTDGSWHFIVSVRQGSNHTIYGDGITNRITGTVSSSLLNTATLRIGKSDQPDGEEFDGNISIVAIYNRALSESEILQNFMVSKSRFGL